MRRSLPISAAVFVVLAAAAWLLLRPRVPEEPVPFFALHRNLPDTLTLAFPPDTTVLVRDGEVDWRIIAPVRDRADGLVVDALLRRAREMVSARSFPLTPDRMDTYGMRFPRIVLRAAYADGAPPDTLTVGGFTVNGAYDYIRRDSDPEVGMIDALTVRRYFQKGTHDLRVTRLMPFPEARAESLEVRGPDGSVRFALHREGREWRLDAPWPGPGEAKAIDDLLAALSHMEVRRFVAEAVPSWAPWGLDPPRWRVRVVLADDSVFTMALGDPVPGEDTVYARRGDDPQLLAVSDKYPPVLSRDSTGLRRRAVVTFGLDDVDSLGIAVAGGGRVTLHRDAWAPPIVGETAAPLRDLLGEWILLTADSVEAWTPRTAAEAGLTRPVGRLIWFGHGDTLAAVTVGPARGPERPIRVTGGTQERSGDILEVTESRAGPLWGGLRARVTGVDEGDR